jgi:hypothetical protein
MLQLKLAIEAAGLALELAHSAPQFFHNMSRNQANRLHTVAAVPYTHPGGKLKKGRRTHPLHQKARCIELVQTAHGLISASL